MVGQGRLSKRIELYKKMTSSMTDSLSIKFFTENETGVKLILISICTYFFENGSLSRMCNQDEHFVKLRAISYFIHSKKAEPCYIIMFT